jgi:mono/diheme cytochrome c family protein
MYKSIVFAGSNALRNPPLPSTRFVLKAHGKGKRIFQSYCASCHSIYKNVTGPALSGVVNNRTNEWIFIFLTDKKKVQVGSSDHDSSALSGIPCGGSSMLSRQDVDLIVDYIKSRQ